LRRASGGTTPTCFSTYPDAHRKDNEALIAFVRSKTDYPEKTQRLAVRTFKVLCEFGDFDQTGTETETKPREEKQERKPERKVTPEAGTIGLTVNIQLQLPPSVDGEIYDKLFAAMAKHLKGLVTVE
jgi:hypothetical protein